MGTLHDAITKIQGLVGAVSGIRSAPVNAPESANVFPFAVCYPESGTWEIAGTWKKGLHTVVLEVHVQRRELPRDVSAALQYGETIVNTLFKNPALAGVVDTIKNPIVYSFGYLEWAGQQTLGWQFRIKFKQESEIK